MLASIAFAGKNVWYRASAEFLYCSKHLRGHIVLANVLRFLLQVLGLCFRGHISGALPVKAYANIAEQAF